MWLQPWGAALSVTVHALSPVHCFCNVCVLFLVATGRLQERVFTSSIENTPQITG